MGRFADGKYYDAQGQAWTVRQICQLTGFSQSTIRMRIARNASDAEVFSQRSLPRGPKSAPRRTVIVPNKYPTVRDAWTFACQQYEDEHGVADALDFSHTRNRTK